MSAFMNWKSGAVAPILWAADRLGIREIYSKGSANIHYGMTKQQLLYS